VGRQSPRSLLFPQCGRPREQRIALFVRQLAAGPPFGIQPERPIVREFAGGLQKCAHLQPSAQGKGGSVAPGAEGDFSLRVGQGQLPEGFAVTSLLSNQPFDLTVDGRFDAALLGSLLQLGKRKDFRGFHR